MRQYLIDEKGVEHIVHLNIENWWVGDRESWVTFAPSVYCIDAWEDTELLLITREETLKLAHQSTAFNVNQKRLQYFPRTLSFRKIQ